MNKPEADYALRAGTGFMNTLTAAIKHFEGLGYRENLVPRFDHFEYNSGKKLLVDDFKVDEMRRFENTSDPDDQSILYAVSSAARGVKGLYVDSYGLYHDDLSREMYGKLAEANEK